MIEKYATSGVITAVKSLLYWTLKVLISLQKPIMSILFFIIKKQIFMSQSYKKLQGQVRRVVVSWVGVAG
jgi:hypothetical protein